MLPFIKGKEAALAGPLRRTPLAETELPPEGRERLRRAFGQELSPEEAVERILREVRARGDAALCHYTRLLDGVEPQELEVPAASFETALGQVEPELASALRSAAERVRAYHERQRQHSWKEFYQDGVGQLVRPLDRVGVYVPGGSACYPSTVLMTAIPARVAGVGEIIMVTPPGPGGAVAPAILAACHLAGVDRLFGVGGAQAIAALAYGTETVPRVDKIVGPGNLFVVLAKRRLYGQVGIDLLPGPTETLLIADESANPAVCAADLLAQAEHDPLATPLLVTTSEHLARWVQRELERQVSALVRRGVIEISLKRGAVVLVESLDEALELANAYAPEHLCLAVADPLPLLPRVRHAGGVFLGEATAESLGDYTAGPSHVMPTGGTARFSSPLNVADFLKIISVVGPGAPTALAAAQAAVRIARAEGLDAHAAAILIRQEG